MSSRAPIPSWAFTVRQNVNIVRRSRKLFAYVAIAVLLGALIGDQLWPKMYSSIADLLTQPVQITVPGLQNGSGGNVSVSELEYMQTQVEIATSLDVLAKVATEDNLVGNDNALKTPFDQLSEFVQAVEIKLHLKQELLSAHDAALAEAVQLLKSRVTASVVKDSYVLEIAVSTRDTHLSQTIANSVVADYLDASNQNRLGQLDAAQTVLQQQLTDAKTSVDSAQADLEAFDKANGTVSNTTTQTVKGSTDTSGNHQSNSSTTTTSQSAAEIQTQRQPLVFALQVQQDRYISLVSQLDQAAVEEAAIKGQVSLSGVLNQPGLASQEDGIDRKYRILIYILLAPTVAVGAIYGLHYFEIYRRTAPGLVAVKRA